MVEQSQQLADESGQPRAGLEAHAGGNVSIIQDDPLIRPTLQNPHQPCVGEAVPILPGQEIRSQGIGLMVIEAVKIRSPEPPRSL